MASYILRRLAYMVILLVALSVVVFIVIQLPSGDMMTVMLARMETGGADASLGGVEITAMESNTACTCPPTGSTCAGPATCCAATWGRRSCTAGRSRCCCLSGCP